MAERLALVSKPDAERAIASLRERGVYDPDRSVREHGADTVGIPVTREVDAPAVLAVVEDADPVPRTRGLADRLRECGHDPAALSPPASWAVVGSVVLADFDGCAAPEAVGEALLDLHGEAETVLDRGGVAGPHREPDVSVVAGTGETATVHVEHGTVYGLDLAEVMFSPGNKAERRRTGEVVDPDERVLDMFAGVGYFALPAARAGADVLAVERNPAAFRHLVANARRNGVADRVRPVLADCRDTAARRDLAVDRVFMGHFDAPAYLDAALGALAPGGVVHLHATGPADDPFAVAVEHLGDAAADRGGVRIRDRRVVKSTGPGVVHVVVEAERR